MAGQEFVFEAFAAQLRRIHEQRGNPHHARSVRPFSPRRLIDWIENEAELYFDAHPDLSRFKLHNLRGTAMSLAKSAGATYEEAAIAFGRNPATMREHYISLDEVEIADRVMDLIHRTRGEPLQNAGKSGENRGRSTGRKKKRTHAEST